jgi:hypothetical protein
MIYKKKKRRNPFENLRRFYVERLADVSGLSGTGIIALGTCFPNGKCVMQWQTEIKSLVIYDSISELEKIHGHGGKTLIKWLD